MDRKQQIVFIVFSFLFCGLVLFFLMLFAKTQRTYVAQPSLQQVPSLESSFQIWRANNLHGRILVIIDRHLNADDAVRSDEFFMDEFPDQPALERCCSALRTDLADDASASFSCTIDDLNSWVKRLNLYPLFHQRRLPDPAGEITTLAGYMAFPGRIDLQLPPAYGNMIPRLNRLILQQMHPGYCPALPEYHVAKDNYVYQAVRAGVVRKVYHLISNNAWQEVSGTLSGYKIVQSSGAGYRTTMAEGVPVRILPLRMMPSLSEPAVVVVNTDSLDGGETALLPEMIKNKLHADVITLSGNNAGIVLKSLEDAYAPIR